MRTLRTLAGLSLLTLALPFGCGDDEDEAADAGEGEADDAANANAQTDEPAKTDDDSWIPTPPPSAADRYKHWSALHPFIDAPVLDAQVIDDDEAIAATRDGHVGLTRDGGQTWLWTRAPQPVVRVTGYPDGPYVLLHEGALSLSPDGRVWAVQPRFTDDVLIDVIASELGLIAIGKRGTWLHFAKDGSGGQVGELPDGFRAQTLAELNGAVLALAGKKGYGTTDAATWTALEAFPSLPDGRTWLTSAGSCALGKVNKGKGVVCSVGGTAHGIGTDFAVENKGVVALTRDGGTTWTSSRLPFASANAIFGKPGGPYYAVGKGGGVAISKDGGKTWVDQKWEDKADLLDGLVDGDRVLIVGANSTIVYSNDGAKSWNYAQPPVGKNFSWIGKVDGRYVASDGRVFVTSDDGVEWVEIGALELPGAPGPCDGAPAENERCRFASSITSPADLPELRALEFRGDVGLAWGDRAHVAITRDGGQSWTSHHGLGLDKFGAIDLSVHGSNMVATDGARLLVSTDGGATWKDGQKVGTPRLLAVHISPRGPWIAAGNGVALTASGDAAVWIRPKQNEPIAAPWVLIHEVGDALFLVGARGELSRSDTGDDWATVFTGEPAPVIAMAGEGETIWAATAYSRKSNNVLLRSDDGGRHFTRVRELADATDQPDLAYASGVLSWRDLVSRDGGESWRSELKNYFPGAVDVGDGSGLKIVNRVLAFSPDRLYLVTGSEERDWVRVDTPWTEGGQISCDPTTGCWMLAGGRLYRPLN